MTNLAQHLPDSIDYRTHFFSNLNITIEVLGENECLGVQNKLGDSYVEFPLKKKNSDHDNRYFYSIDNKEYELYSLLTF